MKPRVLILGAGFGGLELTAILSETLGDDVEVVLVDQADSFVFGFSKLDVMIGRKRPGDVRHAYARIAKPGVRFVQTAIRAIDPRARSVQTDAGTFDADYLVIALGADLDPAATPGLVEGGNEFYSVPGAEKLRDVLPELESGHAIIGVCGRSFKCPPAPSEAALMLHDYLEVRGRRAGVEISLVMPFGIPIPPSPDTSQAILAAFAERGIRFVKDSLVTSIDPARQVVRLHDGSEMPFALFLGVPVHRAPAVVVDAGLTEDGWIPVDQKTLATRFPGVYAVGDVTSVGTPKAGVFAEGAARVVGAVLLSRIARGEDPAAYDGAGSCYIELGGGRVARVDVDFLGGPKPTGTFRPPVEELVAEKAHFGSSRLERWFGAET
ncbi:MAG: NAD(P)/FAD-dependent oxidoreductase [Gemmatimonadales bacterium]